MKRHVVLTLFLIGAIAAFAGFYLKQVTSPAAMVSETTGQCRPDYALKDLAGSVVSGDTWDGQVVLLNFWAAWCPPCRREIPAFGEVRELYHEDGFEVVGIAIDDHESVEKFLGGMSGVNYPQLIGTYNATAVMREFGNTGGGLPFSVLLDRGGKVRFTKSGELKKITLIEKVETLLGEAPSKPCHA